MRIINEPMMTRNINNALSWRKPDAYTPPRKLHTN
jgi:hypothetical protein